jgi:hypothetical protein
MRASFLDNYKPERCGVDRIVFKYRGRTMGRRLEVMGWGDGWGVRSEKRLELFSELIKKN